MKLSKLEGICLHEAGHALVAHLMGGETTLIDLHPEVDESNARTHSKIPSGAFPSAVSCMAGGAAMAIAMMNGIEIAGGNHLDLMGLGGDLQNLEAEVGAAKFREMMESGYYGAISLLSPHLDVMLDIAFTTAENDGLTGEMFAKIMANHDLVKPEDTFGVMIQPNKLAWDLLLDGLGMKPMPTKRAPKPGRNDPCYCGSGAKYKRCCAA